MKTFLAISLLSILLISGCTKNDPISVLSPTRKITRTELLTNNSSKSWQITSAILNSTESLKDCESDNTYSFSSNGNSIINFGFTKCDTSENEVENRTWKFIDNEKRMEWISATDTFVLSIESIDIDELKLVQNSSFNGTPLRISFNL